MDAPNPTHCIDCRHAVFAEGLCANPAVAGLDDLERAIYDDPHQPCPCFEAKEVH